MHFSLYKPFFPFLAQKSPGQWPWGFNEGLASQQDGMGGGLGQPRSNGRVHRCTSFGRTIWVTALLTSADDTGG